MCRAGARVRAWTEATFFLPRIVRAAGLAKQGFWDFALRVGFRERIEEGGESTWTRPDLRCLEPALGLVQEQ